MADEIRATTNAPQVAAGLGRISASIVAGAAELTRHHGQLLVSAVQRRSSLPRTGPPGPRLQTGDYVRSWNLRLVQTPEAITAVAGTNRPQARRLEFGFTGVDSIGRRYHQPPYAHARPALLEIGPQFVAALRTLPGQAAAKVVEP